MSGLQGLLGELGSIAQCVGGILTIIPSAIGQLSNLPGFLTSLIGIPASLLNPVVSGVISGVSGVLSGVESIGSEVLSPVTSIVGDLTSAAGSVVDGITSNVGSIVSAVNSDLGGALDPVTSIAGDATSAAGGVVSAVESIVTGVVGGATSAVGGVLSGIGLRERDQSEFPFSLRPQYSTFSLTIHVLRIVYETGTQAQPLAVQTGFASQPTSIYLSSSTTAPPPLITPTPAPVPRNDRPFGIDRPIKPHEGLTIAALQGGMDPLVFNNLLDKYGFKMGEDLQEWRKKDEARRMKKRNLE